jgi:hypothetical protein
MVKDIFEALQNTPIPTILVVAGIAFLLLSVAGQLAGRIAVPPERQRHATIIGGLPARGWCCAQHWTAAVDSAEAIISWARNQALTP